MIRHIVIGILLLALSGCNEQVLYSKLSEQQVNEMVAVLQMAGLSAKKENLGKGLFAVTISSHHFANAVEHLYAYGYPREQFDSLGNVFKKEGFVSSPLEERARLVYAQSQEMGNTIARIDGVVMARVHLAVPEKNPLNDTIKPSSASVFIKHRREVDLSASVSQIKSLVVNGVEGLPYDNVTVALFAMEPMFKSSSQNRVRLNDSSIMAQPILWWAVLMAVVLLGGIVIWLWFSRQRRATTALNKGYNTHG